MAVQTTLVNKPLNPRGNDQSPLAYNRAKLFSGKALDFDGVNDYVDIGQNLGFLNTGDFTLLANAKFDVLSGDEPIMGQGSGSTGSAVLALVNALGKLRFAFYGDDLDWDEPIQTGKWYSLAFTFNRTTKARAIYVNGQLAVSDVTTLTPNASGNTFVIGKVPYSSTYADAQTTGVKAFNTALTAAQVADLYNNPEKVVPTGVDNTALKLWLPMQEGAGTTAYDGSGNGNHGTISGATYVHGIGAPVAQTAVIDWNKGTNEVLYSEDFSQFSRGTGVSVSSADAISPDGTQNADTITFANGGIGDFVRQVLSISSGVTYTLSIYARSVSGNTSMSMDIQNSLQKGFTITNEWARYSYTFTTGAAYSWVDFQMSAPAVVEFWGAQLNTGSVGPYVRTGATAQTSPVLLPQGLTTGRDITGVNLFENVRKQGALNLDGNSWAEVHDNESLDFGTGSFTLEAWVKVNYENQGSAFNVILGLGGNASDAGRTFLYYNGTFDIAAFAYNNNSSTSLAQTIGNWIHMVGTYDETNATLYINGAQADQDQRTAVDMTNALVKMIGRDTTSVRYYNDQIAQPRIYNRALTAEEVQRNYNAGKNIYTN